MNVSNIGNLLWFFQFRYVRFLGFFLLERAFAGKIGRNLIQKFRLGVWNGNVQMDLVASRPCDCGIVGVNKKHLPIALLLVSLAFNMALFTGGAVYKVATTALESVTGLRSVASQHASALAELGNGLDLERKANRELRGEVADINGNLVNEKKATKKLRAEIADVSGNLASEKKISRKLRSEVVDVGDALVDERKLSKKLNTRLADASASLVNEKKLSRKMGFKLVDTSEDLLNSRRLTKELRGKVNGANRRMVTYKGKKMALSKAVETTSDRVSKRAAKTSAREIASMGGEALPVIGTAVIVAATTYEIYDLCETIKDMNALKFAFNPDLQPGPEETTVCSIRVPTKEELWANAKASPGAAWNTAKKYTPSIEDVQNYEFPDVDWTGIWATTAGSAVMLKDDAVEGSARAWGATKEGTGYAWEATKDGAGNVWEGTRDGTANFWATVKEKTEDFKNGDNNPDEEITASPELTTQPTSP